MEMEPSVNVLGGPLEACSMAPKTGFFRDGHCNTCWEDRGLHSVCAVMTAEFLAWSAYVGNDLTGRTISDESGSFRANRTAKDGVVFSVTAAF